LQRGLFSRYVLSDSSLVGRNSQVCWFANKNAAILSGLEIEEVMEVDLTYRVELPADMANDAVYLP
jgi:hypothetical protein